MGTIFPEIQEVKWRENYPGIKVDRKHRAGDQLATSRVFNRRKPGA